MLNFNYGTIAIFIFAQYRYKSGEMRYKLHICKSASILQANTDAFLFPDTFCFQMHFYYKETLRQNMSL